MNDKLRRDVGLLWDYMKLHQSPGAAECLLVLGSRDDRVASYAAQLTQKFIYDHVVVSGGVAPHNEVARDWPEPTEAEHFAAIMRRDGCTQPIVLETNATNTGQNAKLSYALLRKLELPSPRTVQLLTKPYMERRANATFEAQWPDKNTTFRVCSPPFSFEEYCLNAAHAEKTVTIMVGDMQRIMSYPALGWQTAQDIPDEVYEAYQRLIEAGYTQRITN